MQQTTLNDRGVLDRIRSQLQAKGYGIGVSVLFPVKIFRASDGQTLAALTPDRGNWRTIFTFDAYFKVGEKEQLENDLTEILRTND